MSTIVLAAGIRLHFQFMIISAQMKARRMKASPLDRIRFSLLFHLCLLCCSMKFLYFQVYQCLLVHVGLCTLVEPSSAPMSLWMAHIFFFFADFVCMLSVKEGHFTCFQMFFFIFLFFYFIFFHHPIANKANMKGGGSEMPAKRKMRKERRKDNPKNVRNESCCQRLSSL